MYGVFLILDYTHTSQVSFVSILMAYKNSNIRAFISTYFSGHSAFLFIVYAFWKFLFKKLHKVVALQKNVYSMYKNFNLLDMATCLHTNTSNSNSVSFKYDSCFNIHPQKKNKSGS